MDAVVCLAVVVRSIYGCRDHRACPFEGMYVFSSDAVVRSSRSVVSVGRLGRLGRSRAREGDASTEFVGRSTAFVGRSTASTTRRLSRHSFIDSLIH